MPDRPDRVQRFFLDRGIDIGRSNRLILEWAWREQQRLGPEAARFMVNRLVEAAKSEKVRNPAAFVTWAAKQPIGCWMPDRDVDEMYRLRKCGFGGPPSLLSQVPTGTPIQETIASVMAQMPR